MASSQVYVALDDGTSLKNLQGGEWSRWTGKDSWYGGTTSWPSFSKTSSDPKGSMSIDFHGTSIAIIGNTLDPSTSSPNFQVVLDSNSPYTADIGTSTGPTYSQWYQSPTVGDGAHTIQVNAINGLDIDMMLVTPGQDTPLQGSTLLVDDAYEGLSYAGTGWNAFRGTKNVPKIPLVPIGNGTHETGTVGDTFSFSYQGSSLTVYGLLQQDTSGSLALTYSLDGGPDSSPVTHQSTQGGQLIKHYPLLSVPSEAGQHTVTVRLAGCDSQQLIVDYVTYEPAFDTLGAFQGGGGSPSSPPSSSISGNGGDITPSVSAGSASANGPAASPSASGAIVHVSSGTSSPSSSGSLSGLGSSVQSSGGSLPTSESSSGGGPGSNSNGPNDSSSSTNTNSDVATSSSSAPTAAIAGGVVGGVALLAGLAFLWFWLRRRRRRTRGRGSISYPNPFPMYGDDPGPAADDHHRPFFPLTPSTAGLVSSSLSEGNPASFSGGRSKGFEGMFPTSSKLMREREREREGQEMMISLTDLSSPSAAGRSGEERQSMSDRRIAELQRANERMAEEIHSLRETFAPPAYNG